MLLINLAIIVVCLVVLIVGATFIVEGAARLARHLGVSELVIGLTVVAIGTSAPEFAVTIAAALRGQADISVSNVVGSNIFNLGFILGGVAAITAIHTSRRLVYRDGSILIGTTLLLLFFLRDLELQRWEGGVLFACLIVYVSYLIYQREAPEEEIPDGNFTWLDVPRLIVGIVMVVGGGHFLVDAAVNLARLAGVSEWAIGVTIIAAGTSMPELVTSLIAAIRGHEGLSIGNLIGSDLFNLLGVLGVAGLLQTHPMLIDRAGFSSVALLSGMVILVVVLMRTGWKLTRWEGLLLVGINIVRWYMDFTHGSR
ncbi:MAG: calcium/sodium antiporter [Anaerolineae bacterium]|nr:calcium/sodium antiporter [Anaerolineae bacterium]